LVVHGGHYVEPDNVSVEGYGARKITDPQMDMSERRRVAARDGRGSRRVVWGIHGLVSPLWTIARWHVVKAKANAYGRKAHVHLPEVWTVVALDGPSGRNQLTVRLGCGLIPLIRQEIVTNSARCTHRAGANQPGD